MGRQRDKRHSTLSISELQVGRVHRKQLLGCHGRLALAQTLPYRFGNMANTSAPVTIRYLLLKPNGTATPILVSEQLTCRPQNEVTSRWPSNFRFPSRLG